MRILVTGGAGFIGSNFIRHFLNARPDGEIVNFDKLTYAGNLHNLTECSTEPRYRFIQGDIADSQAILAALRTGFDGVVNFAAETHVDRGFENPTPFLRTNVLGTQCLLESAYRCNLSRFIHISTDEVYGPTPAGTSFPESTLLNPRNLYAASKAAADHLVSAFGHTHGLSTCILRSTNNYGPYQYPEKLIPLVIANANEDRQVPIYGQGLQERDWLFVDDFCRAIIMALDSAPSGSLYNVSSGESQPNLTTARAILRELGKPESLIGFVEDRPGHDKRYSLVSAKIGRELGWTPRVSFEQGLALTVRWYLDNTEWLEKTRSGEYLQYYERHYLRRAETLRRFNS